MRAFLVLVTLVIAGPAVIACPAPPPMTDKLTLLTPGGTTIPADGGLLVRRDSIMEGKPNDDGVWTVRERGGGAVAVTIEPLSGRLERWTFATTADRELEIVNRAGKVVAVVKQSAARDPRLEAPKPTGVTSTLVTQQQMAFPGIPGATVVLQLARKPPTGARYLVVTLDTAGDMAVAVFDATAGTPRFESTTHAGKGCGGGSMPLAVGQRVSLSWVDAAGRRSPPARVVVARAR